MTAFETGLATLHNGGNNSILLLYHYRERLSGENDHPVYMLILQLHCDGDN